MKKRDAEEVEAVVVSGAFSSSSSVLSSVSSR